MAVHHEALGFDLFTFDKNPVTFFHYQQKVKIDYPFHLNFVVEIPIEYLMMSTSFPSTPSNKVGRYSQSHNLLRRIIHDKMIKNISRGINKISIPQTQTPVLCT